MHLMKRGIIAACLVLTTMVSLPSFADNWDRRAQEGQWCSLESSGYQQCDYNLVCYPYSGRQGGVCARECRSTYDCRAGQTCVSSYYGNGVCAEGGGYNPGRPDNGGYYPGRPDHGYGAGPGQMCSAQGYPYPRCERPYACANPDRNGVGTCSTRCRSDYDCYNGGSCYNGSCYEGSGRRPRR